jgi:hypothetical protein
MGLLVTLYQNGVLFLVTFFPCFFFFCAKARRVISGIDKRHCLLWGCHGTPFFFFLIFFFLKEEGAQPVDIEVERSGRAIRPKLLIIMWSKLDNNNIIIIEKKKNFPPSIINKIPKKNKHDGDLSKIHSMPWCRSHSLSKSTYGCDVMVQGGQLLLLLSAVEDQLSLEKSDPLGKGFHLKAAQP